MKKNDPQALTPQLMTHTGNSRLPARILATAGLIFLFLTSPLGFSFEQTVLADVVQGEPINAAKPSPVPPEAAAPKTTPIPSDAKPVSVADSKAGVALAPGTGTGSNPAPEISKTAGGYLNIDFERLASYDFAAPDVPVTNRTAGADEADKFIPVSIKRLDGKKVLIKGFMLPLKVEAGKVTEFLILRNQSACCFGVPPKMNEVVSAKIAGNGVKPIMDQPVGFKGTLHVGTSRENGYITDIYRLDAEKMADAAGN